MRPDPIDEQDRWQRQAERDLEAARHSASGGYFDVACFLGQQAAEKSLKAFLYGAGRADVRGHSVGDLCDEAGEADAEFSALKVRAKKLDRYYIPTRYPDGLPGGVPFEAYDAEDATAAADLAAEVLAFVRARLRRRPPRPPSEGDAEPTA